VHYNISPDGTLLAGDGGGPGSVANQSPYRERLDRSGNGQWIYLFRTNEVPKADPPDHADTTGDGDKHAQVGTLRAERLVDLSNHDYDLEPNAIFTPDGKWIVFRSNMHGPSHVYMVEVARAE